jgi:hypothetical protein
MSSGAVIVRAPASASAANPPAVDPAPKAAFR